MTSKTTTSSSDSCFISIVSTLMLFTIIAARCFLSPYVKILIFLINQKCYSELYMVLEERRGEEYKDNGTGVGVVNEGSTL